MALVSSCIDLAQAMGSAVLGLAITKPYPLKMYGDLMVAGVEPLRRYRARNFQDANQTLAPLAAAAKSVAAAEPIRTPDVEGSTKSLGGRTRLKVL